MIEAKVPPEVKTRQFLIRACLFYASVLPSPLAEEYSIRLKHRLENSSYKELDVILNSPLLMPAEGEYWVDQIW